ncbi:hypothetical protein N7488_010786 [Penicillium malachiteum]|nr:hypothetical protein N7488_010786 [Penicillium malachiteum]
MRAQSKMRGFQTAWFLLFSVAVTAAATSTDDTDDSPAMLNFRPFNVTLSSLYYWVGSYFNGTARFEFYPYAGLAASSSDPHTKGCPALCNKTITKDYKSILALTEPSTYNTAPDPVNAFLTLWPLGLDFGSKVFDKETEYLSFEWADELDYAIYSSAPVFGNQSLNSIPNNFNWSLEETQAPPYILSSILTEYEGAQNAYDVGQYPLQVNTTTTNCNGSEVSSWQFQPLSWNTSSNASYLAGTNFTDPVINLQFNGQTANLTMKGYVDVSSEYWIEGISEVGDVEFAGEFTLTFEGVIDTYHSDVLRNDMATPTWLRTVGYQNNSLNVGYTTSSSASGQMVGLWSLAMIILLSQMLLFFR